MPMSLPLLLPCLLALASAAAAAPDGYASEGGAKMRRIPGMFPRPIIGRSNPATWLVDISDIAETDGKLKRGEISGLFAYPRIGRSGPEALQDVSLLDVDEGRHSGYHGAVKRDGDGSNSLWFGPRLGRMQKKAEEAQPQADSPWAVIAVREYPQNSRREDSSFTPRLGRESGEEVPVPEDYDSKHRGDHV